jgi:hypothetical protein
MIDEQAPIEVTSGIVRCSGGGKHAAVEIVVVASAVAACPLCGRRFRGVDPAVRIDPAVWPKEE